jgi:hypothetical protein
MIINAGGMACIQLAVGQETANAAGSYRTVTGGSTSAAIAYNAYVSIPSQAAAKTIYSKLRPVSAQLSIENLGNTATDGGQVIGCWYPDGNASGPTTIGQVLANPYAERFPLRNGCRVLWRPRDNRDWEFMEAAPATGTGPDRPIICIYVFNATPGQVVGFSYDINWEGIPITGNTTLVQASESPTNSKWAEEAMQWGQKLMDKVQPLFESNSPFRQAAEQFAATKAKAYLRESLLTGSGKYAY